MSALMLWLPLHIPHEQGERKTSPEDLHMAAEWIPSPSVHRSIGKKKNHGAASLPTRERGDVRKSCLSTHYSRW